VRGLKTLDGVISCEIGTQEDMYDGYKPRHGDFTHALVVRMRGKEDLENYSKHEEHRRVVVRDKIT